VWITIEVLLEEVDGLRVLVASKEQFLFALTPGLLKGAREHR